MKSLWILVHIGYYKKSYLFNLASCNWGAFWANIPLKKYHIPQQQSWFVVSMWLMPARAWSKSSNEKQRHLETWMGISDASIRESTANYDYVKLWNRARGLCSQCSPSGLAPPHCIFECVYHVLVHKHMLTQAKSSGFCLHCCILGKLPSMLCCEASVVACLHASDWARVQTQCIVVLRWNHDGRTLCGVFVCLLPCYAAWFWYFLLPF